MLLFLYRLALQLGEWNVEDPGGLLERMSWHQLKQWMAAFQLMPWGDEWLRDAVLMSQQYNVHRPKGKKSLGPQDFLPVKPITRTQTPDEMFAALASRIPGKR